VEEREQAMVEKNELKKKNEKYDTDMVDPACIVCAC
jgi:hypothetical protein